MALLSKNRDASLVWIQEELGLTSGNLDSHIARLAAAGYVESRRALGPGGFSARVRITPSGDEAYARYRAALLALLEEG